MDLGQLAEVMHAEHLIDVPALRDLTAENCGTCQRWAKYALAGLGPVEYLVEYDLAGNAVLIAHERGHHRVAPLEDVEEWA